MLRPSTRPRPAATEWVSLAFARRTSTRRRPFVVDGEVVGSVDERHVSALTRWRVELDPQPSALVLRVPAPARDEWFANVNLTLRDAGLVRAWRDESFPLLSPPSGRVLATMERAAMRFWGTLTRGAHCNGWVAGSDGRPQGLWIARRAESKATDPGKLDNLIGGGVPCGQTPRQTLVREGFEEAGLSPSQMARATPGRIIEILRDVPEGLQFERLHTFDLQLRIDERPANQDGEVASVALLPIDRASLVAATPEMTVDASLVTLDFLLRHGLIHDAQASTRLQLELSRCLTPLP